MIADMKESIVAWIAVTVTVSTISYFVVTGEPIPQWQNPLGPMICFLAGWFLRGSWDRRRLNRSDEITEPRVETQS